MLKPSFCQRQSDGKPGLHLVTDQLLAPPTGGNSAGVAAVEASGRGLCGGGEAQGWEQGEGGFVGGTAANATFQTV